MIPSFQRSAWPASLQTHVSWRYWTAALQLPQGRQGWVLLLQLPFWCPCVRVSTAADTYQRQTLTCQTISFGCLHASRCTMVVCEKAAVLLNTSQAAYVTQQMVQGRTSTAAPVHWHCSLGWWCHTTHAIVVCVLLFVCRLPSGSRVCNMVAEAPLSSQQAVSAWTSR